MKKTIIINKETQITYIPDDIIKEGYTGEIEILFNFNTGLMLRPGSSTESQIRSVERLLGDLRDRLEEEAQNTKGKKK